HIYFLFFPLVGCQIVIQNFFQSIGKPGLSIFLSLTRQLIFLLPFLMILPRHFGIDGVWASVCGSDLLAFLLAAVTLWVMMYKHKKEYSDTRN
ncbi:MAG: MATE family efflux transporter, partial [Muribaculum sp.]|nr:MATE family efflux transporter [Muribaculum sp.]